MFIKQWKLTKDDLWYHIEEKPVDDRRFITLRIFVDLRNFYVYTNNQCQNWFFWRSVVKLKPNRPNLKQLSKRLVRFFFFYRKILKNE